MVSQCHIRIDADGNLLSDDRPECRLELRPLVSSVKPRSAVKLVAVSSSATPPSIDDRLRKAQQEYRLEHRTPANNPIDGQRATTNAPSGVCDTKKVYIRADALDNFMYQATPAASDAKGASISYTNDQLGQKQAATVTGMVSYVLGNPCLETPPGNSPFLSGYVVAPWIYANGTWNEPAKKGDTSVAKVGTTVQWEISRTPIVDQFYASVSPYYLTDFQGLARAGGVALYFEPSQIDWHLGSTIVTNDYIGWFWQFRAEADFRNVQETGLTNLVKGNYEWLGATTRLNVFLFPITTDVPPFLQDRISLIGTIQYYWDARSGIDVRNYTAQVKYKLAPCKVPDKTSGANKVSSDCTISGSSSISLEYDNGTDKDTLVSTKKYLVKLDYAY